MSGNQNPVSPQNRLCRKSNFENEFSPIPCITVTITRRNANVLRRHIYKVSISSSGDDSWGINLQHPYEIIAYHHHMGDRYEIVGSNIVDVWKADYARYDEIGE